MPTDFEDFENFSSCFRKMLIIPYDIRTIVFISCLMRTKLGHLNPNEPEVFILTWKKQFFIISSGSTWDIPTDQIFASKKDLYFSKKLSFGRNLHQIFYTFFNFKLFFISVWKKRYLPPLKVYYVYLKKQLSTNLLYFCDKVVYLDKQIIFLTNVD